MRGNFHHVRTALAAVQQMQQMQQMQLQQTQALQPAQPAPTPPQEAWQEPVQAAETQETDWWYQGPHTCQRCGQKSYLRGGICYNVERVSWLCSTEVFCFARYSLLNREIWIETC